MTMPAARCRFHLPDDVIDVDSPESPYMLTHYPPAVGDVIWLSGHDQEGERIHGFYTVLSRTVTHAAWGSTHWPRSHHTPAEGPLFHITVEPTRDDFPAEAANVPDESTADPDGPHCRLCGLPMEATGDVRDTGAEFYYCTSGVGHDRCWWGL